MQTDNRSWMPSGPAAEAGESPSQGYSSKLLSVAVIGLLLLNATAAFAGPKVRVSKPHAAASGPPAPNVLRSIPSPSIPPPAWKTLDRPSPTDAPPLSAVPTTTSTVSPHTAPRVSPAGSNHLGSSCQAAVTYLASHAAPGYSYVCPGNALGHQAMTCFHLARVCGSQNVIIIANPCPAAYMNEAWNSRLFAGLVRGRLDPYGSCSA